jgi:hypothetical protein
MMTVTVAGLVVEVIELLWTLAFEFNGAKVG